MPRANLHLSTSAAWADALFVSPSQPGTVRLALRSRTDHTASPSQLRRAYAAARARVRQIPLGYEEHRR